mgnify:CR=1 FL=1
MRGIPVLQAARRSSVFLHGFRFAHCRKDGLEFFVKHLAAALHGVIAVHIDGAKAVAHAHAGGGIAIDRRFHGDIVFRELVAGLGVVAVRVQRFKNDLNTELLKLRLDQLRVTDMGFLACVAGEGNKRGNPNMTVVNEPGLYTLILSSRKPEAKAFKRWITHDVIPMIRKTGGYMTDSLLERIQKEPAVIVEFAQALILERNRVKALECELITAKPKADYYDAFINPDDCTNIRTTAKELKIPERKFVQFLLKEKYLFRSPSGQLLPYNKDSNAGLFIVRDFVTFCYTGSQTYFTPKGKEVIRMKFQKKCGEELLSKMAR